MIPPDYGLYVSASRAFIEKLKQYTDQVIQYSIDEAWAVFDGYENLYGQGKRKTYMLFIGGLQKLDGLCGKFDEELWTALLDYATVYARGDIRFTFKSGNEVKVDG